MAQTRKWWFFGFIFALFWTIIALIFTIYLIYLALIKNPETLNDSLLLLVAIIPAVIGIYLLLRVTFRMNQFGIYEFGIKPTRKSGKLRSLDDVFIPYKDIINAKLIEVDVLEGSLEGGILEGLPYLTLKILDKNKHRYEIDPSDIIELIKEKKEIERIYSILRLIEAELLKEENIEKRERNEDIIIEKSRFEDLSNP